MTKNDIEQIEFLKEHVVKPMIAAFETKVQPIMDAAAKVEERLIKLESNQRKALTGYTAFITVVSTGLTLSAGGIKNWIMRKVKGL